MVYSNPWGGLGSYMGGTNQHGLTDPYAEIKALGSKFNPDGSGYEVTKGGRKIKIYGPRLSQLSVAQSAYGLPIIFSIGVSRVNGNLLWTSSVQEKMDEDEDEVTIGSTPSFNGAIMGGGAWGNSAVTTEIHTYDFLYFATLVYSFGIRDPELVGKVVTRIWADKQLIWDLGSPEIGRGLAPKKYWKGLDVRLWGGYENQSEDKVVGKMQARKYEAEHGSPPPVNIVSAYKGQTTIRFRHMPLGPFGNKFPSVEAEIADNADLVNFHNDYTNNDTPIVTSPEGVGIDWDTATMYSVYGGLIRHVDLDTNDIKNIVPLQGNYKNFAFSELTGKAYMSIEDPDGQTVHIDEIDLFSGSGSRVFSIHYQKLVLWCTEVGKITPVPYMNGTSLEDVLVVNEITAGSNIFLSTVVPDPITLMTPPAHEQANVEYHLIPGPVAASSPAFYWYKEDENKIYQSTSASGGISSFYTPPSGFTIKVIIFHRNYNILLVAMDNGTDGKIISLTPSGELQNSVDVPSTEFQHQNSQASYYWQSDTTGSNVVFLNGGSIVELDLEDFVIIRDQVFSAGINNSITSANYRAVFSFVESNYYDKAVIHRYDLKQFIELAAQQARIDPAKLQVQSTVGTIPIDGAYLSSPEVTFRMLLDNLREAFMLTTRERDGVLQVNYRPKGTLPADFNLTDENDLILLSINEDVTVATSRKADDDLAFRLTYHFLDYLREYEPNVVVVQRSSFPNKTNESGQAREIATPIIMRFVEAKQWALDILYAEWIARNYFAMMTIPELYALEPGDAGQVTIDGLVYVIEIIKIVYNADFTIGITAKSYATDYPIAAVADPPQSQVPDLKVQAATIPVILDIAPVMPGDGDFERTNQSTTALAYAGGRPSNGGEWGGAKYYLVENNIPTYLGSQPLKSRAKYGILMASLGAPPAGEEWSTDIVNQLRVKFLDTTFAPQTRPDDEFYSGRFNNVILGNHADDIEILMFKTAVNNGDGTFTLTNMLRGRSGTNDNYSHKVGDRVLMAAGDFLEFQEDNSRQNLSVTVLAQNLGYLELANPRTTTMKPFRGRSALPFSPWDFRARDDGADNLVITWVRRSRAPDHWPDDGNEAPFPPIWEKITKFEIRFFDDGAFSNIIGTTTAEDTTTLTLNAAARALLLGSGAMPTVVHIRIAQVSQDWGNGIGRRVSVNVTT